MRRGLQCIFLLILLVVRPTPCTAQGLRLVEQLLKTVVARSQGEDADVFSLSGHDSTDALQRLSKWCESSSKEELFDRFDRLQGVDASLRTAFRSLSDRERCLVIELAEEGQSVLRRHPQSGAELLTSLNVEGLVAARIHGSAVVDGAAWLSTQEVAASLSDHSLAPAEQDLIGRVLGKRFSADILEAPQAINLWVRAFHSLGDGVAIFWKNQIQPHQEKWLEGDLLIGYLTSPTTFHNAAGEVTADGAARMNTLEIKVLPGEKASSAADSGGTVPTTAERYPLGTIVAISGIALLVLLAVPPIRARIRQAILFSHWSNPRRSNQGCGYPRRQPLRE